MILIGENIHIISKNIREALVSRDETFITDLIKKQAHLDYIDLNVGPAKGEMQGILTWLANLVEKNSQLKISFDTTNIKEMEAGLKSVHAPSDCLLNSASADIERLENVTDLASEFQSNLIALTTNKEIGIPKTSDERLALAFEIFEKCMEKGIDNSKIFFDPLILPVSVDQSQSQEALNTIQMIKQSFEPHVMTTIGLSNISNGSPREIRPLINRVFAALSIGAGIDSFILDAFDEKLIDTIRVITNNNAQNEIEKVYIDLADMIRNFGEIEDVCFDENDPSQVEIIKTAKILLNKEIYSHSFTQI